MTQGRECGSSTNRHYRLRDLPPNDKRGDNAARAFLHYKADGVNLRENYILIMTAVAEAIESGIKPINLVGKEQYITCDIIIILLISA